ncbi:MAG: hypothetical protein OZ918_09380 [Nitrospirales bacterium]|nr:hypothetical protein [Nitrospirales bacterium]
MRQDVKGTQRRCNRFWLSAIGLFLVIVGTAATPARGAAGTFRFVIQDVEGGAAAWFPREVVIHKSTDLEGGLIFILENPTPRTHVFEAPDLFEQVTEGIDVPAVKPLRVYVAPGETVQVRISTEQLFREPEADASGSQNCPFFCPLHGTEDALRSMIRVVP